MKKKYKLWQIIVAISFGFFILFKGVEILKYIQFERKVGVKNIPINYLAVLESDKSRFSQAFTEFRELRKPISSFVYEKKYNIKVFAVDLVENKSLKDIVLVRDNLKDFNISSGIAYASIGHKPTFNYAISKVTSPIQNLCIYTESKPLIERLVENDSLVCFYFKDSRGLKINYKKKLKNITEKENYDIVVRVGDEEFENFERKTDLGLFIVVKKKQLIIGLISNENLLIKDLPKEKIKEILGIK